MTSLSVFSPAVTFFGGGLLGHLEVWMDLRAPHYAMDPVGQPGSPAWSYVEVKVVVPNRSDYVVSDSAHRGTDPNADHSDVWEEVEHQTSGDPSDGTDLIYPMPSQQLFDDHYIVQAGMHRVHPFGVTGGDVGVDSQIGGAINFLFNWKKIAKPEFFGLPAGTPVAEWPPFDVELYGSVQARDPKQYDVFIQFRLLSSNFLSKLERTDPGWCEITYGPGVTVIEESERVARSYNANYHFQNSTTILDARQHIGTLRFKWVTDPEDPMDIKVEILEP